MKNGLSSRLMVLIVSYTLYLMLIVVGGGFFTMKHNFINVREDLYKIYSEYDAFAIFRIVYDEIDRFNTHFYDNFFSFNKDTP